ncbi:hypothetical protein DUI87_32876 [Hirundo rustica rustica]|uniref:BHLH domain-containing protein n=1 Tax=Hirundo rustica rustica TaxID=333673 RepID=A0A3M0IQ75_HIRRU|nr:hypothetical protein DUI87_32876 [Hirundo rustica rustica]
MLNPAPAALSVPPSLPAPAPVPVPVPVPAVPAVPAPCPVPAGPALPREPLSREERRRRRRATAKYRRAHATRERIRVEAFNAAFGELRRLLPTLPPDKRLAKIEILRLAICYISYLNHVLDV